MSGLVRVPLPDGARAMDARGRYTGREGDTVQLSPAHAARLAAYARRGRPAGQPVSLGTRGGRRCPPCRRLWQVWSVTCPSCGAPTELLPG